MNAEALGVHKESNVMGYENKLFDTSKVHTLNIIMDDWDEFLNNAKSEIDDVFQTVWVKAIDRMPQLRNDGSFYGYLQQTARNIVIDRARKLKRRGPHVTIDEDPIPIADQNAERPYFELSDVEEHELLNEAVASLNEEQRTVWSLRMKNYSFKEIAEKEKCSINTALARMSYAKKNIKIFLEKHL